MCFCYIPINTMIHILSFFILLLNIAFNIPIDTLGFGVVLFFYTLNLKRRNDYTPL